MQTGDWYYVQGDEQFGPVPFQVLQTLARSGSLGQSDLVWSDGMADWVEASTMQELFGFTGSPTVRPRGARGGRKKSGGRPASRRPNRALSGGGAPGMPPPGPVVGAPHAPPPAGPVGVGTVQKPVDREERAPRRRARSVPGSIIFAAILNFLVVCLTMFAGSNAVDQETQLRGMAESATSQEEIDFYWERAEKAATATLINFAVAGCFIGMTFLLLSGQSWGPMLQTILSGIAALPYILIVATINSEARDLPGADLVIMLLVLTIVFLLGPIGCVWTRSAQEWIKSKSGGGTGRSGGRGAPSTGRRRF